ncbi:signal peptidase I [Aneurinibacillus sp. REN35]|uniref:signal peptidase I n=1 Tax=Aneurinibacillus sp. REN35 TaxID=3237286 RepID=UPI003528C505
MRKLIGLWMVYMFLLGMVACSFGEDEEMIKDWHTRENIRALSPKEAEGQWIVRRYGQKDMENWRTCKNHKCRTFYLRDLVIDTNYGDKDISRGDIIYHAFPDQTYVRNPHHRGDGYSLSRVIAFGGERVRMKRGQIYVNGKTLETFYGRFQHKGMDIERYLETHKNNWNKVDSTLKRAKKLPEANMREMIVPSGRVFVMDDDWIIGVDSRQFDALPLECIKGRVSGYLVEGKGGTL